MLFLHPGGPRPRRFVHKIGLKEVLSFDEKGKAHITARKNVTSKAERKQECLKKVF